MPSGYRATINGNVTDLDDVLLRRDDYPEFDAVNVGRLWSWGINGSGQLGLGDIINRSSPVQVGTLTNWKSVAAAYHTVAIKTDGTLWSWGSNTNGQLGLGDTTHRSSPVQVGSLTDWKSIIVGGNHTLAIKTDGTLWSWGLNSNGQLGLGDLTRRSSPVQVGALTNWKSIEASSSHTIALKTDGTLWGWGANTYGQLGLGDTTHRSSPVQAGSLTNWKLVDGGTYHTVAIKTDGTLWSWGGTGSYGDLCVLGDGTTTPRSSPVQVGALTNWKVVGAGRYHTVAVKTDGTLWSWGLSLLNVGNGELGLGDNLRRISPVQVGTLTNWKHVMGGSGHSVAIKTDGTLWSWGRNTNGQLGLDDITHRSSPVQAGSLTNWKSVTAGGVTTTAFSL